MTFRFLHSADVRLDTPVAGVSLAPDPVFRALRDASLAGFDALIEATIQQQCRFLLLTGGIYDGPEVGLRGQIRFYSGLERLSREGIITIIALQVTDPMPDAWSAIPEWPAGVHFLSLGGEPLPIEQNGERLATVYPWSEDEATRPEADNGGLLIGLSPSLAPDNQAAASTGFQYVAVGGIHVRQVHAEDPWIVNPGTLQGRSFDVGERGPKGAMLVTAVEHRVHEVQFAAMDVVRFEEIVLDVSELSTIAVVREALMEMANRLLTGLRRDGVLVLSTVLSGSGPVHEELSAPGAGAALLQALPAETGLAHSNIWWSALRAATRRERNLEAVEGRGDLSAELLTTSRTVFGSRDRLDSVLAKAPGLLHADVEDVEALVAEAELRALDLLERLDEA